MNTNADANNTPHNRLATPNAPNNAPTQPRMTVGKTPAGTRGTEAPLKGTKLDKAEALAADPPVPPPVKLAPFGPIGRELSVNWHVDDVHMQFPAIGSQNGVEQLEGNRNRA